MSDDTVSWLAAYEGLGLDEALALAAAQGRVVRVLGPRDVVTLEWMPERLNLYVDDARHLLRAGEG